MDISDFSYEDFASTLSKARIISQKYKYTCCIPGCNEITLKHSHIVPQCVLKTFREGKAWLGCGALLAGETER